MVLHFNVRALLLIVFMAAESDNCINIMSLIHIGKEGSNCSYYVLYIIYIY